MKLTKLPAPPYWVRWAVGPLGTVERRGGFARWTALDVNGRLIGTMFRTRSDAVSAVLRESERQVCTCGAGQHRGCFCNISLSDFLHTPGSIPREP